VCVSCLEQRSASVSYTAFPLLLALFSLSPFLPVCTSSFPFIHQTSFSRQHPSLDAAYAALLVAPVRRHASRHFPHAVSSQRSALLPSAVSGALCFPHDDLLLSFARLLTLRALVLEARSPLVPSLVPSLSFTHTTHTHTRSIPRLVRLLVPTPVA